MNKIWIKNDTTEHEKKCWQALQQFYRLKSLLVPSFMERNKRALNLIEANLMKEYEKGGEEK